MNTLKLITAFTTLTIISASTLAQSPPETGGGNSVTPPVVTSPSPIVEVAPVPVATPVATPVSQPQAPVSVEAPVVMPIKPPAAVQARGA